MKKYAKLIIALGLAGGIMLTGCQKNESGSAEPTATPEPTGILEGGQKVYLEEGSRFTLTTEQIEGNNTRCSQTYKNLPKDVKVGDTILIDDGLIQLTVENVTDTDVVCRVVNGGELGQKKGINVPNVEVKLPAITEQDKKDILFGIEQGIDFIAASFVRNAEAIKEYIMIFATSVFILAFDNLDLITNFTAVAATFNNIGPGLELVGPTANFNVFSDVGKYVLIFDMLAGRLEIFPLLLVFFPDTWRKF